MKADPLHLFVSNRDLGIMHYCDGHHFARQFALYFEQIRLGAQVDQCGKDPTIC